MEENMLMPRRPTDSDDSCYLVPRLKPTVGQIKKLCGAQRGRTFKTIYDIGLAVQEGWETTKDEPPFFGDPQKYHDYLQQVTGLDPRDLHDCQRLVVTYDRAAFNVLVQHPHISWTHVRQLLRIPTSSWREKLEQQLITQKWSTRQLTAAVMQLHPPASPTHGRLPSVPSNPQQCLRQITTDADRLLAKCDSVWFGKRYDLCAKIADLPAEKLTEQVALQLAQAEKSLSEVGKAAQRCSENLAAVKQLVHERLAETQLQEASQ